MWGMKKLLFDSIQKVIDYESLNNKLLNANVTFNKENEMKMPVKSYLNIL